MIGRLLRVTGDPTKDIKPAPNANRNAQIFLGVRGGLEEDGLGWRAVGVSALGVL